ncbi:MAG: hypothetical protein AAF805_00145 [Planctomycetota bacterium]
MITCPHCGCNDCDLVFAGMKLGTPYAQYKCDHCKKTFHHGSQLNQKRIKHPVLRCPRCHGVDVVQRGTEHQHGGLIVRRMVCRTCQFRFATEAPAGTQKDSMKRRRSG